MFGPFKATMPNLGGLVWKFPRVMSQGQKYRHRLRMKTVDRNVDRIAAGLQSMGMSCSTVDIWQRKVPRESEMMPKDKYTVFSRHSKTYRKGSHRQSKWTRITNRVPPKGF